MSDIGNCLQDDGRPFSVHDRPIVEVVCKPPRRLVARPGRQGVVSGSFNRSTAWVALCAFVPATIPTRSVSEAPGYRARPYTNPKRKRGYRLFVLALTPTRSVSEAPRYSRSPFRQVCRPVARN